MTVSPPTKLLAAVPAEVMQYIFDLENAVQASFKAHEVAFLAGIAAIGGLAIGWVL